jgi:ADP-ribosyl-[dinitrogen reductase] hydrolase
MMDARLSHPNDACVGAAVAYVMAIRHLIVAPGDVRGAIMIAEASNPFEESRRWLAEAKDGVCVPYSPQDGFVRIAFTHAFRHLMLGTSYVDAIRETLAGGGDTDTNACIVGGLIGARFGADAIPTNMKRAVLDVDTTKGSHPRPDELSPRHVPALVARMI